VLALFSASTALNAFMWICYSPIVETVQEAWDASALDINALSMTYMVAYAPGAVLAAGVTEKYGLRANLITAAVGNAVCAGVRLAGGAWRSSPRGAYAVVLAGQLIGALVQPLMLNAPARIANDWFGVHERDMATVVMTMANSVGNAAGAFLPPLVATGPDTIWVLNVIQTVPALLVAVAVIIAVRDRPATPPSVAAALQWARRAEALAGAGSPHDGGGGGGGGSTTRPRVTFRAIVVQLVTDCRALVHNTNYMLLMVGFASLAGVSWALLTVLAQFIGPCGYDPQVAGAAGGVLLGVGVLAALAIGPCMQRTRRYTWFQKGFMSAAVGATVMALAANARGSTPFVIAAYCVYGAAVMPIFPISLEHAAEVTYPIPADNAAALLLLAANLTSLALTFILTPLIELPAGQACDTLATPAAGVILGFTVVGAAIVLPMRRDYRRAAAEAAHTAALAGDTPSLNGGASAPLPAGTTVKSPTSTVHNPALLVALMPPAS